METNVDMDQGLQVFGETDIGKKRENNEDYFLINHEKKLFLLADGMGGQNAGEVASYFSCIYFDQLFSVKAPDIKTHLLEVFKETNSRIIKKSKSEKELDGMATTFIACHINGGLAHLCHAGDVRAYHFKDNELRQVTDDHSTVMMMVRRGLITEQQAHIHPLRNMVYKSIGAGKMVKPDYNLIQYSSNDLLMLCSDGLWNILSNNEIKKVLQKETTVREKTRMLIDESNKAGGEDNITVILIEFSNHKISGG